MQIRKNRCDVPARTDVFVRPLEQEYSGQAEGGSVRRELQKSSREPTIAATTMVLEASVVRKARMRQ